MNVDIQVNTTNEMHRETSHELPYLTDIPALIKRERDKHAGDVITSITIVVVF
jgi:hypothetical protein